MKIEWISCSLILLQYYRKPVVEFSSMHNPSNYNKNYRELQFFYNIFARAIYIYVTVLYVTNFLASGIIKTIFARGIVSEIYSPRITIRRHHPEQFPEQCGNGL